MGIHTAEDPELAELAQDVAPENILNAMEAYRQHGYCRRITVEEAIRAAVSPGHPASRASYPSWV
jgi:hypothetical protein